MNNEKIECLIETLCSNAESHAESLAKDGDKDDRRLAKSILEASGLLRSNLASIVATIRIAEDRKDIQC